MKFATVRLDGRETWGAVRSDGFVELAGPDAQFASLHDFLASGQPVTALATDGATRDLDGAEYLPVIPRPAQIFCVGVNYDAHRQETKRDKTEAPTIFLRLPSSQVGHRQPLIRPRESQRFDYEGELAVVIGQGGRRIPVERALDHVFGYSCYNDGSARDWQNHTTQWTPGKNFVGTGSFGPHLVTSDEVGNIEESYLVTTVNGEERQRAQIRDMTASISEVIAYVSTFTPLLPGDVICTGTPGGVGSRRNPPTFLDEGDTVEVSIDGVGVLRNVVAAER